jgi:hypothetical protein
MPHDFSRRFEALCKQADAIEAGKHIDRTLVGEGTFVDQNDLLKWQVQVQDLLASSSVFGEASQYFKAFLQEKKPKIVGDTNHSIFGRLRSILHAAREDYEGGYSSMPAARQIGISIEQLLLALKSFTEVVRYLNNRRTEALLDSSNEAAVQDVLYIMLRPWIDDLVPESPNEKVANRFTVKDFWSKSSGFALEAKYVRSHEHGKTLAREINDDIESYRYHEDCDDLVFFVYDPHSYIPDASSLERHVQTNRSYDGKTLRCHVVIKP